MAQYEAQCVFELFLEKINLKKYTTLLKGQGYQEEEDIFHLCDDDLNKVHIMDTNERDTILDAVAKIDIVQWLRHHKLEEYERHFRKLQIHNLGDLKKTAICDDTLDELEVMIPGHRKRLSMAASHICLSASSQELAAHGYWGNDMPKSEANFLFVKNCRMRATSGQDPVQLLNCMVDTGSEVVTIQEDIMSQLDLRFLQNIKSKGIHKEEEKPLYRGVLILGSKQIEVDVMPDSYNSVGCNVFKQFSHVIDGQNHLWFDSETFVTVTKSSILTRRNLVSSFTGEKPVPQQDQLVSQDGEKPVPQKDQLVSQDGEKPVPQQDL